MKSVHVAVAVIENDKGEILIAKRPSHLHMGGFWEFPGGKVEADETVLQALQREIHEEVALDVRAASSLLQIPFNYPDKKVLLDVWRVTDFSGEAKSCEGQQVLWVARQQLSLYEFPPANRAILVALQMPDRILVTGHFSNDEECLQRTRHALEKSGIRAVMLRAHHLAQENYSALASEMAILCKHYSAVLLLNANSDSWNSSADGLHLTAQRLLACGQRPVDADKHFGASCHNERELHHALAIGADYVLLSPVLPTPSHPDAAFLGWDGLTALLERCPVPAFALGGLDDQHLGSIKSLGGFGIAGISAWW